MGDRDVDWLDQLCEADEKIAELEAENAKLRDQLRWRDAYGEPPTEEGIYLVINNDFDGGTSIHATYWKGKWPIGFTVPYWRPIGSLPEIPVASDSNSSSSTQQIGPLPGGE